MQRVIQPPLVSFSTLGPGSSKPAVFGKKKPSRAGTGERAQGGGKETINGLKFCSANEHHVQTPRGKFEARRTSEVCSASLNFAKLFARWTRAAGAFAARRWLMLKQSCYWWWLFSASHMIFAFCLCLNWQRWVFEEIWEETSSLCTDDSAAAVFS